VKLVIPRHPYQHIRTGTSGRTSRMLAPGSGLRGLPLLTNANIGDPDNHHQLSVNNLIDNLNWTSASTRFKSRKLAPHSPEPQFRCTTWQGAIPILIGSEAARQSDDGSGNSLIPPVCNSYEIAFATSSVLCLRSPTRTTITSTARALNAACRWSLPAAPFSANEFEWYVQDAWHATPNLF